MINVILARQYPKLYLPLKHRNVKKSSVFGLSPFFKVSKAFPLDRVLFVTGPDAVEELDEWFPLREPEDACIVEVPLCWISRILDDCCEDELAAAEVVLAGLP